MQEIPALVIELFSRPGLFVKDRLSCLVVPNRESSGERTQALLVPQRKINVWMAQQQRNDLKVLVLDGDVDRRFALCITSINIRSMLHESLHHLFQTPLTAQM